VHRNAKDSNGVVVSRKQMRNPIHRRPATCEVKEIRIEQQNDSSLLAVFCESQQVIPTPRTALSLAGSVTSAAPMVVVPEISPERDLGKETQSETEEEIEREKSKFIEKERERKNLHSIEGAKPIAQHAVECCCTDIRLVAPASSPVPDTLDTSAAGASPPRLQCYCTCNNCVQRHGHRQSSNTYTKHSHSNASANVNASSSFPPPSFSSFPTGSGSCLEGKMMTCDIPLSQPTRISRPIGVSLRLRTVREGKEKEKEKEKGSGTSPPLSAQPFLSVDYPENFHSLANYSNSPVIDTLTASSQLTPDLRDLQEEEVEMMSASSSAVSMEHAQAQELRQAAERNVNLSRSRSKVAHSSPQTAVTEYDRRVVSAGMMPLRQSWVLSNPHVPHQHSHLHHSLSNNHSLRWMEQAGAESNFPQKRERDRKGKLAAAAAGKNSHSHSHRGEKSGATSLKQPTFYCGKAAIVHNATWKHGQVKRPPTSLVGMRGKKEPAWIDFS
jgi:hypothetical protein